LTDFRMLSKPSRHIYSGYRELRPVRQHYGLAVLTTPQGIMTNKEAKKQKVGGEYLFEIW
jgi:small subunit ribosomal protein S8